jgi:hypothetical protein
VSLIMLMTKETRWLWSSAAVSMATKRLPRPRDPAQLAKLIVDIATGEIEDRVDDQKNPPEPWREEDAEA